MDSHPIGDHAHHAMRDRAPRVAEQRTRWVVLITLVMMVGELLVGWWSGSMALTADGWHMGTHAGALSLTAAAYWFARTRADHGAFAFGTGKVYALAGYTSGVILGIVALWMGVEGTLRLFHPRNIEVTEALWVATLGLFVNVGCALLLGHDHGPGEHGHGHEHGKNGHDHAGHGHDHAAPAHGHAGHDHDHDHAGHDHAGHDHDHAGRHPADHVHASPAPSAEETVAPAPAPLGLPSAPSAAGHDHNLRAAYLHIVADAVTSVLAIVALLLGRYAGLWFADPAMGIVGGAVILSWAIGLCRQAAHQLLDVNASPELEKWVRGQLEAIDDVRVADLHVWEIGPGQHGCVVSLVTARPRGVDEYRRALLSSSAIAHLTVEIHGCERRHVASA